MLFRIKLNADVVTGNMGAESCLSANNLSNRKKRQK